MTNTQSAVTDHLLVDAEVANLIGVKVATLPFWRSRKFGPPHLKIGKLVRYRREDVDRWLASRLVGANA